MLIDAVRVVVPARDEEARLGACLRSVASAAATLHVQRPAVSVRVVVALDSCTDRSYDVAAAAGVETVVLRAGAVGVARAAGVAAVVAGDDRDPDRTWVVGTDADTVVSSSWLLDHVTLADAGHDLVVGLVRPDARELPADRLATWTARHQPGAGHVHGANLGFRLSAYLAVGGFAPVREHEDALLVSALRDAGHPWTIGSRVTTSARLTGRTPGGFAAYLRAFSLEDGA